jgi:hypothetical protein
MNLYIPPQVKRLLLLFIIFIALFILVRRILLPPSFGQYGHYRANSLQSNAAKEAHYAGHETCVECHQDIADMIEMDLHDIVSCESCHTAALKHAEAAVPEKVDVALNNNRQFCGLCHAMNTAKPVKVIFQVDLTEHNTDKNCIDCHNPHSPWELNEENLPEENF